MKFSYQARTKEGEMQTGFVEASSREAALGVLQKYGLYITYLSAVEEPFWEKRVEFLKKISKNDTVFFTRQLSVMLKSSIPVVESLETIAHQIKKPKFRELVLKIAEDIEGGSTLSQAFAPHRALFSPFYIGMMKSGETSGTVSESLDYLADYLEKEQDFTSKMVTALIYPIFVLGVFLLVITIMGIVVVPRFAEVFQGMEGELPITTRIIIGFSGFLKNWWMVFVFFVAVFGVCIYILLKSEESKEFLDKYSLEMPIMGDFLKKYFLTRVALNLSTLVAGGVPILQALEISGDIVGNRRYKDIILKTREGVKAGQTLSSVLLGYPEEFPLLFVQMTVVGERTGHLESTLKNIVTLYEKEVDRTVDSFIKLLEPMMILILGGLVAFLAMSLFVPLFQKGLSI